ncbi:MAG TPA: carbohydrate ABC transporter permease [Spirochaetia bacterium]|jgi:raffinose/stachyose/melibiose transport system permease protein|nr:carbohydrate ABC transporter permease [Spirochaetia bacterium]
MSDLNLNKPSVWKTIGLVVGKVVIYFVLVVFAIMTIYPLLWLFMNSFKPTQEFQLNAMGFPQNWTLANYSGAWKIGQFDKLFLNSLVYTIGSTLAIVLLSMMAAFAFAKLNNKAKTILYGSFIIGILLTLQSIMIPLFIMMNTMNLYNTHLGVLIPYIGIGLPMGVYLGTEYIKSIPDSLVESARLEGASYLTIFWRIIFPMTKPVAITLSILNVSGVWNEFMLINILTTDIDVKSLPVGIMKFSGTLASDYGKQFAALVMGAVPMLVYYFIFRKQITMGVSAGAVKG